jgi:hypothetical protein
MSLPTLGSGGPEVSPRWLLTVNDLVQITKRSRRWIEQMRTAGIISPKYTRGALQFSWSAVNRLLTMQILQTALGENSPIPARVVRAIGARLDQLADGAWIDIDLQVQELILDEIHASVFPPELWLGRREMAALFARNAEKLAE